MIATRNDMIRGTWCSNGRATPMQKEGICKKVKKRDVLDEIGRMGKGETEEVRGRKSEGKGESTKMHGATQFGSRSTAAGCVTVCSEELPVYPYLGDSINGLGTR
jgi:CO dehydrogenase/acetyl-CoA synthase beta subunit